MKGEKRKKKKYKNPYKKGGHNRCKIKCQTITKNN